MLGLIGKKLGQTRVYDAQGNIVPVTVVLAGPNRVIQCKTVETDGYQAVQLGFGDQKESRLTKPLNGHLKKFNVSPVKRVRESRPEWIVREAILGMLPKNKLQARRAKKLRVYRDATGLARHAGQKPQAVAL